MSGGITILAALSDITQDYDIGARIGQPGQFGFANVITEKKTGNKFAAKVIKKTKFHSLSAKERSFHFKQLREEIEIMQAIPHHRNIIRIHSVYEDVECLWLVLDLCAGGELFDRIQNQPNGTYTEKDAATVLKQMAEGIGHLHEQKIAHCDLKPDNFLFLTKEQDSPLKIIDFGMSKTVQRPWKYLSRFRGTPYYVAPEVLSGKYLEHCDIWSFGIVMFVMLFGFPPFHGDTDDLIFKKIENGFTPEVKPGYGAWFPNAIPVSKEAKDLMKRCLTMDTEVRLSAKEVLEHPWFTGTSTQPLESLMLSNLNQFTANSKFKQGVLSLMTNVMTTDDLSKLKAVFKKYDKNGDGFISVDEVKEALNTNKDDCKQLMKLEQLMKLVDLDGDGQLSYDELLMISVERKLVSKEERLFQAFCKVDSDKSGTLSTNEIEAMLGVTKQEANKIISEVDKNGDGVIDYDEFVKMMMNKEKESMNHLL